MTTSEILLIEDSPDDAELTQRALKKGRISNPICWLKDGEEAITHLKARLQAEAVKLPQVILLDIKLPKVDGLEVLQWIRSQPELSTVPVVILTSSREDKDIARGYELGANSYICKPVDMEQFTSAVQQVGLYWLVLNELNTPISKKPSGA